MRIGGIVSSSGLSAIVRVGNADGVVEGSVAVRVCNFASLRRCLSSSTYTPQ